MSEMHPCFESVVIIITLDLHASFMNIHQNTSIKYISEDDSIFSTSKTCIRSCLGYGWLLGHLSIHLTSHVLFSP
jgi:hypothetical protein